MCIAGAVVLAAAVPLRGHHAFGAEFDPDAPIRLQGKVVKLEWVNPHAWIHIEVTKPDGAKEVWMVEGGTPNTLLRRGLTRESLTVGTELDRRRLPDEGPLAQARQRPRRDVHRWPQDVHGLVGHRRAARRPRSDRRRQEETAATPPLEAGGRPPGAWRRPGGDGHADSRVSASTEADGGSW